MNIETRLLRLEIAFEDRAPGGAQAIVEEGVRSDKGETTLGDVLGIAADRALESNRDLQRQLAAHDQQIETLAQERIALIAERDVLLRVLEQREAATAAGAV
jgi:hypothetical protein